MLRDFLEATKQKVHTMSDTNNTAAPVKPDPIDLATDLGDTTLKPGVQLFSFKKSKDGSKRNSFYLTLPFVTFETIVNAVGDETELAAKVRSYVVDLVNDAIISGAREQINDDLSPVNRQEDLNAKDLLLTSLASRPPSDRRGAGIPKETWEEFAKDYVVTMVGAGKTEVQAKNAAKMLLSKMTPYRSQKKVIQKLLENLDVYAAKTESLEEYGEIVDFLKTRGDAFLNVTEEDVLQSL